MWSIEGVIIIFLGISGFIILFLYDLASLKKIRFRFILSVIGYGAQVIAIVMAALGDRSLALTGWVIWLGWAAAAIGLWWLVYSLFLFVPIGRTYREEGGPVLTTEGPYAFSRHPGFIGYVVFMAGLVIVSRSMLLLVCGLVWSFCNIVYIVIQDRWLFRVLFPGYGAYSATTPMLFPTAGSVGRFLKTINFPARRGG